MKYALTYGLLSGFVIITTMIAGIALSGDESFFSSEWFGYLVMLVSLTFIFVGVKRYRDVERGGVIKFVPAFALGLGIAAAAGVAYVTVWEAYLAFTDYAFMDEFVAGVMRARQAAGVSAAAMAEEMAKLESLELFGTSVIDVETDGGSGTAGSHWDDATYGNELMTGYIDEANYFSSMSAGSFGDLGYHMANNWEAIVESYVV